MLQTRHSLQCWCSVIRRAEQRQRDRRVVDEPGRHRLQRDGQSRQRMGRAGRRIDQRHRLVRKLKAGHQPVQRVLHHAGDAAGIFRAGDQQPVSGADGGPELGDLPGQAITIEVGIEERKIPDSFKHLDFDAGRNETTGGLKHRGVQRGGAQAAGNRKDVH